MSDKVSVSERGSGLYWLVGFSSVYLLVQRALGADLARQIYIREYVRPTTGMQILELGCGPGNLVEYLPDSVSYTGVDHNADYIATAQLKYGQRASFICQGVEQNLDPLPNDHFDCVIACGIIHHLDDSAAEGMINLARKKLKTGGKMVSMDGCWEKKQSIIAKALLSMDRGRYIRPAGKYGQMMNGANWQTKSEIRKDIFRVPYSVELVVAQKIT